MNFVPRFTPSETSAQLQQPVYLYHLANGKAENKISQTTDNKRSPMAFAYLLCRGVYSLYEFAPTDYLQILDDARPQL